MNNPPTQSMLEHEYITHCGIGAAISHYVSFTLHNIASPCKLKVLVRSHLIEETRRKEV
jgi:hypothetical protein